MHCIVPQIRRNYVDSEKRRARGGLGRRFDRSDAFHNGCFAKVHLAAVGVPEIFIFRFQPFLLPSKVGIAR